MLRVGPALDSAAVGEEPVQKGLLVRVYESTVLPSGKIRLRCAGNANGWVSLVANWAGTNTGALNSVLFFCNAIYYESQICIIYLSDV